MSAYMKKVLTLAVPVALAACLSGAERPALKDAFDGRFLVGVAINRSQIHQRNAEEHKLITTQFN